jgi:DHA2 family multidrug resistance protein-like MFS transporter
MPETNVTPVQKATRREWIGLAILTLPTLLISIDMTVTYLALPAISAALKPTSTELLWITDIYGFLEAGLLIVMGSLGDRIGLRKILMTGGSAFAIASALAAFSTSPLMLIAARAILGIAGATILPTVLSLIRNMFHDNVQRTFAMGLYTTCFSSGTMLGPVLGGLLLSHFWWGSVFLVAIPIMLLLLCLAPALLPEFKDAKAEKLDLASAVLLITASLATIFGIKQTAQNGVAVLPALFVVAGIVLGVIFYRRQQKLAHPLVDLGLFRKTNFNTALLALLVGLFSWAGIFLFTGQYLQLVTSLNPFKAGLWTMPSAIGSIALCMLAPVLVKKIKRGYIMAAGLLILAAGIGLLAFVHTNSFPLLIVATVLMSGGCGLTVTLGIDTVVASAPPEKAGAAAGISETSTGFGGAAGIALLGSLWTALYRSKIAPTMPANLTPQQGEDIRGTLGGAIDVAKKLPGNTGASLINNAQAAFVQSLNVTAIACAALVLVVAVLVAARLRKIA